MDGKTVKRRRRSDLFQVYECVCLFNTRKSSCLLRDRDFANNRLLVCQFEVKSL